jgi:hypothetical protein
MRILQVTLGAAATPLTTSKIYTPYFIVQNNSNAGCRIGDNTVSATRGIYLSPTGAASNAIPTFAVSRCDNRVPLFNYFLYGTAGSVVDVLYE